MSISGRRTFLHKTFSLAGVGLLAGSAGIAAKTSADGSSQVFDPPVQEIAPALYTVEFKTTFPRSMTLAEYRALKEDFENKEKVMSLLAGFKKTRKIVDEQFSFHGASSCWRVSFENQKAFDEWMVLTEALSSHLDDEREKAGFKLQIHHIA